MPEIMKKRYKVQLLRTALKAGDLGGRSIQCLVQAMENDDIPTEDPISNIIFNAIYNSETKEDMVNDLNYAINTLVDACQTLK